MYDQIERTLLPNTVANLDSSESHQSVTAARALAGIDFVPPVLMEDESSLNVGLSAKRSRNPSTDDANDKKKLWLS